MRLYIIHMRDTVYYILSRDTVTTFCHAVKESRLLFNDSCIASSVTNLNA